MPPSPVVRILRGWNENTADRPPAPTGRAAARRADGARGVLDDGDVARVAQRRIGVEVGGYAGLVDHDHRPGAVGDHGRDGRRRSRCLSSSVDVGEDRCGADVHAPRSWWR